MSEVEYMLLNDSKEKKSTGRGASRKKGGPKKKGCTLPFELSPNKNRNGEVVTTNIHRPIRLDEFKLLPEDIQKMYLNFLIGKFDVSQRLAAEMFGTSQSTVHTLAKSLGVKWPKHVAGRPSERDEAISSFREFCGDLIAPKKEKAKKPMAKKQLKKQNTPAAPEQKPEESTEELVPETADEPIAEQVVAIMPETVPEGEKSEVIHEEKAEKPCQMEVMQMVFSDVSSWAALYEKLKRFPIEGSLRVSIECKPE